MGKNISFIKKVDCCGCGACQNVCPTGAICMQGDQFGFIYPNVDNGKCISCGKCVRTCPQLKQPDINNTDEYFCKAAMASDNLRKLSSSGGVFSLLAESILENGGVVVGAAFDEDNNVKHIIVESSNDLYKLRGSKYVQSYMGDIYNQTKNILEQNQQVLFSGTPCQIAGLYSFLNKDYSNLYTLEIMCHGVSSQGMLNKYLSENFKDEKIQSISFRSKENGWNYNHHLKISNGEKDILIPYKDSSYFALFLDSISLRDSCYECKYATFPRVADITLGDFWEIWAYNKNLDDGLGTSLVLINNKKGTNLYSKIQDQLKLNKEISFDIAKKSNGTLTHPVLKNNLMEPFRKNYNTMTLNENYEQLKKYKFDFAIYNFWWGNGYGNVLTAWALQEALKQFGQTSTLISYLYGRDPNKVYFNKIPEKFAREHLSFTKIYNSEDKLKELNNITDKFIVGSDQVFRDAWIKDCCFLNFVDYDKIKIAFSASFGTDSFNVSAKALEKYKFLLSRFDYVSVRELSGINICQKTFNVRAKQVMDPVFFISQDKWDELISESELHEEGYILSYMLDKHDALMEKIDNYAKLKNKKVIKISTDEHTIQDWLYLFKNADYIITDSFHGLCFSMIFNKQVNCLINVKRGVDRFTSLQLILNIPETVFFEDENEFNIEQRIEDKIIYDKINANIIKAKEKGLEELQNVIKLNNNKKVADIKARRKDEKLLTKYYKTNKIITLLRTIFSIRNSYSNNKKYKVITILGVKIKIKRK